MLVDVIGSRVLRKVTEFKSFPFYLNNFTIDQSLLALTTDAIPISMKEINTTDLTDITIVYRDLNKGQWEQLQNTKSDILIIDFLGELPTVSESNHSYFSSNSLKHVNNVKEKKLSRIEQFRKLLDVMDTEFINFVNSYDKVFLLKIQPNSIEDSEFVNGLYNTIEPKLKNKIILNIPSDHIDNIFDAPLEFYHEINTSLRKYFSDGYENQLLFDERLVDDKISVFMNYLGNREYRFDLLKNGETIQTTSNTSERYMEFTLKSPGKYRIRVNLVDNSIKPRLSKVYSYKDSSEDENHKYIEMPDSENLWMIDILVNHLEIDGFIGSPYKFPYGFKSKPVYHPTEITSQYISANQLLQLILNTVEKMDHVTFTKFINSFDIHENELLIDFIKFLKTKR